MNCHREPEAERTRSRIAYPCNSASIKEKEREKGREKKKKQKQEKGKERGKEGKESLEGNLKSSEDSRSRVYTCISARL